MDSNPTYTYVTGAVHVYCRVPDQGSSPYQSAGQVGSGAVLYLGTCETRPEEDKAQVWAPHHNSQGGELVKVDDCYQGPVAEVRLDLNKYSNTVLRKLRDAPNFGRGGAFDGGFQQAGDVGKMLLANGCSYELWLVNALWLFRSQAENITAFPDLEPGTYYRACKTTRVFEGRKGVTPNMVYLEVETVRSYDAFRRVWLTWSSDPAYFVGLPDPL